jgi:phosphoribosylglycinamide formyltransferase-1
MEAILKAIKNKTLRHVEVPLVISDNNDAKGLEITKYYKAASLYIYPGPTKTKLEGDAEAEYIQAISGVKPDLIVLAGFMRILKERFIKAFPDKIINIHPSLLPKYPGLHTHLRALEAGDNETGCTVHFVNGITDGGKRIMQAKVPVFDGDTENTIAYRVLQKEHVILPKVISLFANRKISYDSLPDEPVIIN